VSGSHHYGSRKWHDANWEVEVVLGEDVATQHSWDNGGPPVRMPRNAISGASSCLASGELIEDSIPSEDAEGGFVETCYLPLPGLDPRWYVVSDYNSCKMQKFYAGLLLLSYLNKGTEIVSRIVALLGNDLDVTWHPANALMPAVTTIIHPTWSVVIVDGTRTYQQIAVQGFTSISSPQSFGAFSTLALWYQASQSVRKKLSSDGATPGAPIMLVGHSYGGAAALVLGARFRVPNKDRLISYLTFGTPKTGDAKLHSIIAKCDGINLANDGDLVTIFPPDALTLFPVMLALGVPGLSVWTNWIPPPSQVRMSQDGKLHPNDQFQSDYATLFLWASNAIAVIDEPFVFEHSITEYLDRILKRCPGNPPDPPIVPPGLSCPVAVEMLTGIELQFDILSGEDHWFLYKFSAGAQAGVTIAWPPTNDFQAVQAPVQNCLSFIPINFLSQGAPCLSFAGWVYFGSLIPAERMYVRCRNVGPTTLTYRIRFIDVPC